MLLKPRDGENVVPTLPRVSQPNPYSVVADKASNFEESDESVLEVVGDSFDVKESARNPDPVVGRVRDGLVLAVPSSLARAKAWSIAARVLCCACMMMCAHSSELGSNLAEESLLRWW